jgi:hypothetical protein
MTVMGSSCGEWWTVIESIRWEMFGQLKLLLKALFLLPILENVLLLVRERKTLRCCR